MLERVVSCDSEVEGRPVEPKEKGTNQPKDVGDVTGFDVGAGFDFGWEDQASCQSEVGTVSVDYTAASCIYHADVGVDYDLVKSIADHMHGTYD